MVLKPLKIAAVAPTWQMHFSDAVETVLLETAPVEEDDFELNVSKPKKFKVPQSLIAKGITPADFEDVENGKVLRKE